MPKPPPNAKKPIPKTFVRVPHNVLVSPAFMTLTHSAQLVIIDLAARFSRLTAYGQNPEPPEGIPYGYPHCTILIPRSTFATACAAIETRGFFERFPTSLGHGKIPKWRQTTRWRSYQPTPAERDKLLKLYHRQRRQEVQDSAFQQSEFGHDDYQIPANPLLTYWTPKRHQKPSFWTPLIPILESRNSDRAHATGSEEPNRRRNGQPTSIADILGHPPIND